MTVQASIPRRAFTLVEITVCVAVLAIISVVVLPVMNSAIDAYAASLSLRRSMERSAFAMERTVILLRDAPEGSSPGTLGIVSSTSTSIVFTDGRGLRLNNGVLYVIQGSNEAPLARNVTQFSISLVGADGVNPPTTPAATQRFHVSMTIEGSRLSAVALARVRGVPG